MALCPSEVVLGGGVRTRGDEEMEVPPRRSLPGTSPRRHLDVVAPQDGPPVGPVAPPPPCDCAFRADTECVWDVPRQGCCLCEHRPCERHARIEEGYVMCSCCLARPPRQGGRR